MNGVKLLFLLIFLLFLFIGISQKNTVQAVTFSTNYSSSSTLPNYSPCPSSVASLGCGGTSSGYCWNNGVVGASTTCGDTCPAGNGGQVWTRYQYATCYLDPNSSITDPNCINWYSFLSNACSTGDKCGDASGNNTGPYLNAGLCDCSVGGQYKTCCSGSVVSSNSCVQQIPQGPYPPYNGVCPSGTTTVPCGTDPSIYSAMGYSYPTGGVSCGTPACQLFLGTPTPSPTGTGYNCVNNSSCQASTNGPGTYSTLSNCQAACGTSCPTYAPPAPTGTFSCPYGTTCTAQGTAQTVQTACSPTNSQCSPNCSITCTDSQGHTCPATSCTTVWACQGSQWYNGGQYYYTCPASCPNCTIGATQTTCGPTSVCHAP